jgi:hypothetical protein
MSLKLTKKFALVFRAGIAVLIVVVLKLVAHKLGWEVLSLSPLFSGIVAANVFLLGFLLSGVINDYRESERLPGELSAILSTFMDEASSIQQRSGDKVAQEFSAFVGETAGSINAWFYRKERTTNLMNKISELNRFFLAFEPLMQANYIVRMKQQQDALRRIVIRIHTIRETSFISSGYLIAEMTSLLLALGLVIAKIDPFYESLFVVGVIVFLLSFLIFLIRDLDNPFGYYENGSTEDVSLKPLEDFIAGASKRTESGV